MCANFASDLNLVCANFSASLSFINQLLIFLHKCSILIVKLNIEDAKNVCINLVGGGGGGGGGGAAVLSQGYGT